MTALQIISKHGYLLINCGLKKLIDIENYEACQRIENMFLEYEKHTGIKIDRDIKNSEEKYLSYFKNTRQHRQALLGFDIVEAIKDCLFNYTESD